MFQRLVNGSGCFRGSTITYRLADASLEGDSDSLVFEVKPLAAVDESQTPAMLICVLIGVGGFAWNRRGERRKREEDERRAINAIFGDSPQDDVMWT